MACFYLTAICIHLTKAYHSEACNGAISETGQGLGSTFDILQGNLPAWGTKNLTILNHASKNMACETAPQRTHVPASTK